MAQAAYISPDQRATLEEQPFFFSRPQEQDEDMLPDETPIDEVMLDQGDHGRGPDAEEEEDGQGHQPAVDEAPDLDASRGPLIGGALPSPMRDTQPDGDGDGDAQG